jgi:hypothetical protein
MPLGITLEDAGLFQMVCHLGGLSHPPGYPLFTTFCQSFVSIPMTKLIAGNLVSILFALCALLVLYEIVLCLTQDARAALLAMILYGISVTFWSQAIIIEVYSLAVFLFLLSFLLLLNYTKTHQLRYLYLWVFVSGLSLSNHWPLFMLSSIGCLFLLYESRSAWLLQIRRPLIWIICLAMLTAGLLPYAVLILTRQPEIALVGPINSAGEFLDYVFRRYYSDTQSGVTMKDKLGFLAWMSNQSLQQVTWVGLPLVLWGLLRSFSILGRNYALSLIGIFVGSSFLLVLLIDFKLESRLLASFKPYPIIAYMTMAIWFALAWRDLVSRLDIAKIYKALLLMTVILFVGFTNFQKVDRSRLNLADDYGRVVLNSLPKDAVLFLHGDVQVGPIGYLNRVERLRPDVTVYNWNGLVFSNRLVSARAPAKYRDKIVSEFLSTTDRPVFSIDGRLGVTSNYGLYYGYSSLSNPRARYVFIPELEFFVDGILLSYFSNEIRDAHEIVFVQKLIRAYARLYADFSINYGSSSLHQTQRARFVAMQETFHGKLGTLDALLLSESAGQFDTSSMLSLIDAAESQIEPFFSKRNIATLYQYHADTLKLMFYPTNRGEIMVLYLDSIETMPTQANPSICKYFGVSSEDDRLAAGYSPNFFRECH